MYSSTFSSTSALDGRGWSTPRSSPRYPQKDPVPILKYNEEVEIAVRYLL